MQGAQARTRPVLRQLPYALVATLLVVLAAPAAVALLAPGMPTLAAVGVCTLLALALARGGDLLWRRLPQSKDVLFADLMLWGWARRLRTERRLLRANDLFTPHPGQLDAESVARRLRGLERLTAMIESRDAYTHRHSLRVTRYSEGIARGLGLSPAEVARVRTAAALHDVGKYFTPREILNKPGRLTDEEFAVVKRHPGNGADLVKGLVDPDVAAMIRHHHERLGGTGYPDRLAGHTIPLGARIIAVADTFDAMTSTRAYRSARPHRKALAVLQEEAGTALDAGAVAAFTAYYSGRRGQWLSSLLAGLSPAVREAIGPSGLARVLPTIGTSVALTAPLLTAGSPALSAATPAHATRHQRAHTVEVARAVPTAAAAARHATHVKKVHAARPHGARVHHGRSQPARPTPGTHRPSPTATATAVAGTPVAATEAGGGTPSSSVKTESQPAATTTSAPTAAPTSTAPVSVAPVTVQAGDVTITTPPIDVQLPDLPVAVPTVHVELPAIKIPLGG